MIINIVRKPLIGSVCENTVKHSVGAINIDQTRIGTEQRSYKGSGVSTHRYNDDRAGLTDGRGAHLEFSVSGRWGANVILSHNIVSVIDSQSGIEKSGVAGNKSRGWGAGGDVALGTWVAYDSTGYGDTGGASRYFKTVKENE